MKTLAVVIGLGEIGETIRKMLVDAYGVNQVKGRDIDTPDWKNYQFKFMHICFPQSPTFTDDIGEYMDVYHPEIVIIHSTLSPGMTDWLQAHLSETMTPDLTTAYRSIFYSPVRGNVKDGMEWCLKHYTKYIAGSVDTRKVMEVNARANAVLHLKEAGFKVKVIEDSALSLEYAKLLDLCWYGLNIAFYQEVARIEEKGNLDPVLIKNFIESTPVESEGKVPRHVFYGGFIGGHCVIQGIRKILAVHDVPMLRAVIDSNIKREIELTLK